MHISFAEFPETLMLHLPRFHWKTDVSRCFMVFQWKFHGIPMEIYFILVKTIISIGKLVKFHL